MMNVTLSLDEAVEAKARLEAARQNKSLSQFVSDLVAEKVGPGLTQSDALALFLSGPPMNLTDEHGNAPSRDKLYE